MRQFNFLLVVLILLGNNLISYSQNYYEKGLQAYYNDDSSALELFSKAIENNQEKAKSYMMRGACEVYLGNYSKSILDLTESLLLDSTYYKTYFYLGKAFLFQGLENSAIKYYKIAYSKNPLDANILDELAIAYSKLEDYNTAVEYEKKAILIDKNSSEFYLNNGFFYLKLKDYKNALNCYNQSIKIKKEAKAYGGRASVYIGLKEFEKAIEDFNIAINFMPDAMDLYFYRGVSYKAIGNKKAACEDYEKSNRMGFKDLGGEFKNYCN